MGDADIDTRLFVSGDVSFSNKLYVADDISTNANLYVTKHAQVDGSLNVMGDADIDTRLFVSGDVSFSNKLYVADDISTNANLYVTKHAQVDGSLNVMGDVAIDDRLFVTNDATINTLTVGTGGGNQDSNTVFGLNALTSNSTGNWNTAISKDALTANDDGNHNIAAGYGALYTNSGGDSNIAVGNHALRLNQSGSNNTAMGHDALRNSTGSGNIAVGYTAGDINTTGSYNTYLGYNADSQSNGFSNSTAIGYNSTITKSHQIVLGKDDATPPEVYIPGYLDVSGSGAIGIPRGNDTTDRPTGTNLRVGQLRYNTTSNEFEGYQGDTGSEEWSALGGGGAFQRDGTTAFYNEGNVKIDGSIGLNYPQEIENQLVFGGTNAANNNQYDLAAINTFFQANGGGNNGDPGGLMFKTKAPFLGLITQMVIDSNGKVRIGDSTGAFATYSEKFLVNGTTRLYGHTAIGDSTSGTSTSEELKVYGKVTAGEFDALSDIRFKTNILPIADGLAVINKLNGYNYTWKTDESNQLQSGLIAQEVEDYIPHIVNTDTKECDEGFKSKSINYNGILPYLIESIKTLTSENNMLNEKINSLVTDNANVKSALSTCEHNLEKQNELIEKILKKLEL